MLIPFLDVPSWFASCAESDSVRIFLHFFIDHVSLPKKMEVSDMSNDASVHRHSTSLVLSDDVQTSLFSMRGDFREAGGYLTQPIVAEFLRGLTGDEGAKRV